VNVGQVSKGLVPSEFEKSASFWAAERKRSFDFSDFVAQWVGAQLLFIS
jgi:hypothetical protein